MNDMLRGRGSLMQEEDAVHKLHLTLLKYYSMLNNQNCSV